MPSFEKIHRVFKNIRVKISSTLSIDEFSDEIIARMEIPVMEFSYGHKVHRSDVTYALFNQTPLMQGLSLITT